MAFITNLCIFNYWLINYWFLAISWTSTETQKPFFCLNLSQNQQEIPTQVFSYQFHYKFGKKKQLRHFSSNIFWAIFCGILTMSKKNAAEDSNPGRGLINNVYLLLPSGDICHQLKTVDNTMKYTCHIRSSHGEKTNCLVQMNICALSLIIAEHDPVDFIFKWSFLL